jgi:hypothetical protein
VSESEIGRGRGRGEGEGERGFGAIYVDRYYFKLELVLTGSYAERTFIKDVL